MRLSPPSVYIEELIVKHQDVNKNGQTAVYPCHFLTASTLLEGEYANGAELITSTVKPPLNQWPGGRQDLPSSNTYLNPQTVSK
ncbi:hypothetical protein CDAR_491471 [Caerostris darwini]|uniref:Uncharacterized protein n=1 Tax=Caerostris darwini TaxID=1538125 RepID=A0AAV4XAU2_9ARAC|nr:hypothetical protein CDAR_491471 [Caerostris darwini]